MDQCDLNTLYLGETKQDVFKKKQIHPIWSIQRWPWSQGQNILIPLVNSCHKKRQFCNVEALIYIFISYDKCHFFIGQKVMYKQKDLTFVTRNIHVKYQSSTSHYSKVISKVKVSDGMTERRTDRQL